MLSRISADPRPLELRKASKKMCTNVHKYLTVATCYTTHNIYS